MPCPRTSTSHHLANQTTPSPKLHSYQHGSALIPKITLHSKSPPQMLTLLRDTLPHPLPTTPLPTHVYARGSLITPSNLPSPRSKFSSLPSLRQLHITHGVPPGLIPLASYRIAGKNGRRNTTVTVHARTRHGRHRTCTRPPPD